MVLQDGVGLEHNSVGPQPKTFIQLLHLLRSQYCSHGQGRWPLHCPASELPWDQLQLWPEAVPVVWQGDMSLVYNNEDYQTLVPETVQNILCYSGDPWLSMAKETFQVARFEIIHWFWEKHVLLLPTFWQTRFQTPFHWDDTSRNVRTFQFLLHYRGEGLTTNPHTLRNIHCLLKHKYCKICNDHLPRQSGPGGSHSVQNQEHEVQPFRIAATHRAKDALLTLPW